MKKQEQQIIDDVRFNLIKVAGCTTQDLGLGRIVGQVLGLVYLTDHDCSLDEIGDKLELSKAAVSIAARHLEGLGLLQRVWKKGDKKKYYKIVNHFGRALQHGILDMARGKTRMVGVELEHASEIMSSKASKKGDETDFLRQRLKRARNLQKRAAQILESPIIKLLGR